ncbi:MAG TPA: putative peptidoglycan glycosyltransferase FtsW [Candidatus Limnocylindrales bacterium]|jgi:cell division protein FtsW|nr:putative peptidoglycan glycosyltransferase FtsW [Candidatus Limnocylindrales bacterium]
MSDALPLGRRIGRRGAVPLDGVPRGRTGPAVRDRAEADAARGRTPARQKATALNRERHQADYGILVIVVALTAVGILMVYSSSAMKAYIATDDTLAIVGPQIGWAALGIAAMAGLMRVDYRYLRFISVPAYVFAVGLLILVFVPGLNVVIGGSARWLKIGPLPALHPAEIAKLAMIIYLAHWFAKRGTRVKGFWSGTIPFLVILAPIVALVFKEPDLGTTMVIALTGVAMFFVAGGSLIHLAAIGFAAFVALIGVGLRAYQLTRIRTWLDPWSDPLGAGFHTIQGLLALGLGGVLGAGLGESRLAGGLFLPNASNDYIFAIIGEEFGLVGAAVVVLLFLGLAYSGIRVSLSAPDTFGALLAAGITAWLCIQAFINIGVVVALIPVTGITLPFISAGGSSLTISLAAVGILLSISRETVERGTWNDEAADRRGRDGRAYLPGPRRGALAPRSTKRA